MVSGLSVQSLSCGYAGQVVVGDVSFTLETGRVTGVVGLNGAGKTTLIKTILGLRQPLSGTVGGQKKINKKDIAFLPERFDPPWFLSGREFLDFSLRLYNQNATAQEIEEMAAQISLDRTALDKSTQTYSKGMRQKLGLLATMMVKCPYVFLDEPMSGLDPSARVDVKKLIRQGREQSQAILFSSHILSDIAQLCDDVLVVHGGGIVFQGSVQEMQKRGADQSLEQAFLNIIQL